jgi:hypothetical protein
MRNIDVNLIDRRPESNYLGDNCIVFENFTASIGDLMVANLVYWRRTSGASKRIFATIESTLMP